MRGIFVEASLYIYALKLSLQIYALSVLTQNNSVSHNEARERFARVFAGAVDGDTAPPRPMPGDIARHSRPCLHNSFNVCTYALINFHVNWQRTSLYETLNLLRTLKSHQNDIKTVTRIYSKLRSKTNRT